MHPDYLRSIALKRDQIPDRTRYPFAIPSIASLETLAFDRPVTFLIGENGSGKSTLIEAIAVALGFNAEGGTKNFRFATQASHSELHQYLTVARGVARPRDGFFLRAESFYNVASEVDRLGVEGSYGGKSLHHQSHGESFMALLLNRFSGGGLYILDEPEAALSPARQLACLRLIHDLAGKKSQFIIATHSPILMACPEARIYALSEEGIAAVEYEETEHYQISKMFFDRREALLRDLFSES
jgi:predicted ATPase